MSIGPFYIGLEVDKGDLAVCTRLTVISAGNRIEILLSPEELTDLINALESDRDSGPIRVDVW